MTEQTITDRKATLLEARKESREAGRFSESIGSEKFMQRYAGEMLAALMEKTDGRIRFFTGKEVYELVRDSVCVTIAHKNVSESDLAEKIKKTKEEIQPILQTWEPFGVSLESVFWNCDDNHIRVRLFLFST